MYAARTSAPRLSNPMKILEEKCLQCGVCQIVCNNRKLVPDGGLSDRDYILTSLDRDRCDKCTAKLCVSVCPSVKGLASPPTALESLIGSIKGIYAGHTLDRGVWKSASSGGFVSSFIRHLMEQGLVDGAIMVMEGEEEGGRGTFRIVEDPDAVGRGVSSIYSMVPLPVDIARTLASVRNRKFLFVGRPCQVHAINLAREALPFLNETIILTLSLFCAWSVSRRGVDFLLQLSGLPGNADDIQYRSGNWPGDFAARKDGKEYRLPLSVKHHCKGLGYFPLLTPFISPGCKGCADVLGREADISVGDAWNLGLKSPDHGYSLVVCRTELGHSLFREGSFCENKFSIDKTCNLEDLVASQGNTTRVKASGVLLNLPEKGGKSKLISGFRFMNRILRWILRLPTGSGLSRKLLNRYLEVFWR